MNTYYWDTFSIVRLLLLLVVGILLHYFLPDLPLNQISLIIVLGIMVGLQWSLKRYVALRYKWLFGIVLSLFWVNVGYFLSHQQNDSLQATYFFKHLSDEGSLLVQLNEPLRETAKTYTALCKVLSATDSSGAVRATTGNMLVYFRKDSLSQSLQYGDWVVLAANRVRPVEKPLNPYQFDYAAYLQQQNIFHNCFLQSSDWQNLQHNEGNRLWKLVFEVRQYFITHLQHYVTGEEESAVAIALLLGYRHYLERDIVTTYSATGVTHILSVSGLHVGLVATFMLWLLSCLVKSDTLAVRRLQTVFVIAFIWFFILLAGAPPSALRAGFMFSFMLMAQLLTHRPNSYNVIGISAFCLLLYNPNFLFDIGFQLSYLAILSIAFFYRPLERLYLPQKTWQLYLWQLAAMSLAAQILTFPISLYYFHQFPLLFLLSNFIAIPLSTIILYTGVLFALLAWIPTVAYYLGQVLYYGIAAMNAMLSLIQQIPFAKIDSIMINFAQMLLLYLAIYGMARFFLNAPTIYTNQKRFGYIKAALFSFLGIVIIHTWQVLSHNGQKSVTLYAMDKQSVIAFVEGSQVVLLSDSLLSAEQYQYTIAPHHQRQGITQRFVVAQHDLDSNIVMHPYLKNLAYNRHFIQFGDKIIARPPREWRADTSVLPIQTDYLLWNNQTVEQLLPMQQQFLFDTLLIDGSTTWWRTQQLVKHCDSLQIPYYHLKTTGAWQLHL